MVYACYGISFFRLFLLSAIMLMFCLCVCMTLIDVGDKDGDGVESAFRQLHESVSHLCDVSRVGYIRPFMDTSCSQLLQQVVSIHNICMAGIESSSSDCQKSVENRVFHMQQITTLLFDQFTQISLNRNCTGSSTTGSITSIEEMIDRLERNCTLCAYCKLVCWFASKNIIYVCIYLCIFVMSVCNGCMYVCVCMYLCMCIFQLKYASVYVCYACM